MSAKFTNPRLSKSEAKALETCILRLKALTDKRNEYCGVKPEHKEAVRLYVETWILPALEELLLAPSVRGNFRSIQFAADNLRSTFEAHNKAIQLATE